jgi:hypothetical protein
MCYVVAKDRNKPGCYAMKSRIGKQLSAFTKSLNESLPREGIQIIVISRPTAYGEYAPYQFVDTEAEFRDKVMKM